MATTTAQLPVMNYALHDELDSSSSAAPAYVTDVSRDASENAGSSSPTHFPDEPAAGDDHHHHRASPTRGVKKVPSLRRGAAAYAQLLQSAVMASIELKEDRDGGSSDSFTVPPTTPTTRNSQDVPAIPPPPSSDSPSGSYHSSSGDELCLNNHKRRCEDNDFLPHMPRRTHTRRYEPDDSGTMVLSHHDGDEEDDFGLDDMDES